MTNFTDKNLKVFAANRFLRIRYREWGTSDKAKVVVCVHGLSRNCQDFDDLAAALASNWRVLAIDMPGRGDSDWLEDKNDYGYQVYEAVCAAVLARSGGDEIVWIGRNNRHAFSQPAWHTNRQTGPE